VAELDADADVELLDPELLDPELLELVVPMSVHLWVDVPDPLAPLGAVPEPPSGAPDGAPDGGVDPDSDVDELVLAIVEAGCLARVVPESDAPATSMPIPRLSPRDPATTPAATRGREGFMRYSFQHSGRTMRPVTAIERNGDKPRLGARCPAP
jgi:hypothetical protein